jgi:rhodanese-related sulfurtransferase
MNFQDQKSANETYIELTSQDSKGYLVDVRSNGEWRTSGIVDLYPFQDRVILCEWRSYPSMDINKKFFDELVKNLDFIKIQTLYFICAAGVRSQEAVIHTRVKLEELGATINCVNISDGFEGNTNKMFSFGKTSGWKASGLPWCELDPAILNTELES